jgi:hypothetical protein
VLPTRPPYIMRYTVFGGGLQSDIPFPGLREAPDDRADWVLTRADASQLAPAIERIGEDQVAKELLRAFRIHDGFRLQYGDLGAGAFDITERGKRITWYPGSASDTAATRLDLIERVLALALHAAGVLTLHGSAVAIGTEGVAILAPSGQGKSTLALALTRAGGRLLTDDTIPIDSSRPTVVLPGVHAVRHHDDISARSPADQGEIEPGETLAFLGLREDQLMTKGVPLAAIYILSSVQPAADVPAVRRVRLVGLNAALSLICHTKLGNLLGHSEGAVIFDRAIAAAQAVAVFDLQIVRDMDRMDSVVSQVMGWHATGPDEPSRDAGAARS